MYTALISNDFRIVGAFFTMKKLLSVFLLICILPLCVGAADIPPEAQEILEQPGITAEEFQTLSLQDLLRPLLDAFKEQLQKPLKLFISILGSVLLGATILSLMPGDDWNAPLETVCVLGVFAVSLLPVLDLIVSISTQISQWQTYLLSFVPVFSGVMLTCGQPTQAAIYSGMFLTMAAFAAQLICNVAFPVVQVFVALNAAGGLCSVQGLSDGCALLGKSVKWILGLLSILFSAVLGLQSALAQNADNLAMRTGKFLLSNGIPVIGGLASDAMGSVLTAMKVLKGSLGFAAIAVITISFIPLLFQSVGLYLSYTLGGAVAKSFNLGRAGKVLEGMGQAIGLCISFLVFFFMLVVLSTALMILVGGGG